MDLLNHIEQCMNKVVYGAKYVRYHNLNLSSLIVVPVAAVIFGIIQVGLMVGVISLGKESRRLKN